jgi:hypothetical protein
MSSDYIPLRDLRPGAAFQTCHGGVLAVKPQNRAHTALGPQWYCISLDSGIAVALTDDLPVREVSLSRIARKLEHCHEWYAVRWERLRQLIHDDARHIEGEACAVMANGTTTPDDPPTYAQQMNALIHERDYLKADVTRLQAIIISFADRIAAQSELLSRRAER